MPTARPTTVLHVITRLIVGGAQENTILSCALMDQRRFSSTLAVGPETGPEGQLFDEARARGVEVVVLPDLRREVSPRHDARALRALRSLIADRRPDVVHTHSSKAGILGRYAARREGVPAVVHTVHGWSFGDHQRAPVRLAYVTLERLAARWADRLVVVSRRDEEAGRARRIGRAGQYRLVRSGIELAGFAEGAHPRGALRSLIGVDAGTPLVGSVLRLSPQKDPLTLVRAAARLSHTDAHFVAVGDGPLRAEVEDAVARSGLDGRFHLTGIRRDVAALLGDLDVFVLTSRWEGLPRALIQAMAAGRPIVATEVDGVSDVVVHEETGLLAPSGDAGAVAAAVERLLAGPAEATELGRRAAAAVADFDAGRMVSDLADLYEDLLGSTSG